MTNLGGHDLPDLLEAFEAARAHDRPTCFIAYTIKGYGLPLAGHKDNHAGLMTPAQMDSLRSARWASGPATNGTSSRACDLAPRRCEGVPRRACRSSPSGRRRRAPPVDGAGRAAASRPAAAHLDPAGLRQDPERIAAQRHCPSPSASSPPRPTSPSRPISAPGSTGAGCSRREELADMFKRERIPSTSTGSSRPRASISSSASPRRTCSSCSRRSACRIRSFGERLLPIGTLYDPFIARGLDALNYACYQDARFMLVATPSGVTLAPEGGAHQSIDTPLIGMAQDGLAAFEPAFVDELAVIMRLAFDYMQRDGEGDAGRDGPGCATRPAARSICASPPARSSSRSATMTPELAGDIVDGAYWMREPGPNAEIVVAYTGAVAPEAIEAVGLMGEDRRDVGLLADHLGRPAQCRLDRGAARPRARRHGRAQPCRAAARRRCRAHCGW